MNLILFDKHEINTTISGNDPRVKHIRRTLKYSSGDLFEAGIVNGSLGKAKILRIDKQGFEFDYLPHSETTTSYPVGLIVGLTRPQIAKHILRECASMGIETIKFYQTELGEKSYTDSNLWKENNYHNQLVKGAGQGFITNIPKIFFFDNLESVIKSIPVNNQIIALDNVKPESTLTKYNLNSNKVSLILGSERGLTDNERQILRTNHIAILKLGDRVLRTDTACVSGLTLVLSKLGLM
jgi:RsmE family RNA methyltransferase